MRRTDMRSTGGMKTAAAVTAFLILIITIFTSTVEGQETERESVLSADSSAEPLPYIVNRGVTKSAFGGGSYLIVKFNRTLTFGVVYGNTRMKGPISIFTISSNVDVKLTDGKDEFTIDTYTITASRLEAIYEYEDSNGNSVYDLFEEQIPKEEPAATRGGEIPETTSESATLSSTEDEETDPDMTRDSALSADSGNSSVTVDSGTDNDDNSTDGPELSADTGTGDFSVNNGTTTAGNDTADPSLSVDSNDTVSQEKEEEPTLSADNSTDPVTDEKEDPILSVDDNTDPTTSVNGTDAEAKKERIVKKVSLYRAWAQTSFRSERTREGKFIWTFSLYAKDLKYEYPYSDGGRPLPASDTGGSMLDEVRINFRFTVSPHSGPGIAAEYSTTSSSEPDTQSVNEEEKERRLSGRELSMKIDHVINGWDPAEDNDAPMLFLGSTMIFGLSVPNEIMKIVKQRGLDDVLPITSLKTRIIRGTGGLALDDISAEKWTMEDTRIVQGDLISHTSSAFSSSISIDPYIVPTTVSPGGFNYQFLGGRFLGPFSELWKADILQGLTTVGLAIRGGYNYPISGRIHHDPTIRAVGYEFPPKPTHPAQGNSTIIDFLPEAEVSIPVIVIAFIIMIAAGTALLIGSGQKRSFVIYDDLLDEEEEEIFQVKRKKKDWDRLKIK